MLEFEVKNENKVAVIGLNGTVDLDGARALKDKITEVRQKGAMKIIINCKNVKAVSSAHLTHLLTPIKTLTMIKGKVVFCEMTEPIHKVIKTAMFYSLIQVVPTEEEALQSAK